MLNGVGFMLIIICVFGSFVLAGGKLDVILGALPHEMLAIGGASAGAFLVANPMPVVKKAGRGVMQSFRGARWTDSDIRDLLTMMFGLLSLYKKSGATAIEPHLDDPQSSAIFTRYPRLLDDTGLIRFICDYLRMMTVNFEDPHQLSEAMEGDIEAHLEHEMQPQHALQIMADGLPAIGIIAAVLGVIKTMGSIDQPVEVLGAMIGGALVGTFLGVLLSYCFVGPVAAKLGQIIEADVKPYTIAKTAIVAHARGMPTQVAIEIARRAAPSDKAPTFHQLETALEEAKNEFAAQPA